MYTLTDALEDAQNETESSDRDILASVVKVRRALDEIENAIANNLNVKASASGAPFVASDANDLVRALSERRYAYATLAMLNHISS
jgi:predicted lipid-binding transport protein (Tim44 family)